MRAHLPRPEVPLAFKLRVKEALAAQEIAPRRWPWLSYPRLVPAAAALLLIVGITSTVRQSQSGGARAGAAQLPGRDADGHHRLGLRLDRLLVPRAGRLPGARAGAGRRGDLPGGRLVNVGERPAAYIVYREPTVIG